ncbi:MAG: hypothetical protein HYS23_01790 [Geobacter sp.]|nr:hypothetical protein [Geobacter sp.]
MITTFRTLFTVSISHAYYSETCNDIDFVLPLDSRELLRNAKVIWRVSNGVLYFLYETDAGNGPLISLSGETVRFRLKLLNPYFMNFTELDIPPKTVLYYRNQSEAEDLGEAKEVLVTGDILTHSIMSESRPINAILKDRTGTLLAEESAADAGFKEIRFPLSGYPPGIYIVEEGYPGSGKTKEYYHDVEMLNAGALGVAEIVIAESFYGHQDDEPLRLKVPFRTRENFLEFYVIAKNYSQEELDQLKVEDKTPGTGENGDSKPLFEAIPCEKLTPPYNQLGGTDAKVVLFKSNKAVPRSEVGSRRIQLFRNGETLIKSLPLPRADKPDGRIVIHISK